MRASLPRWFFDWVSGHLLLMMLTRLFKDEGMKNSFSGLSNNQIFVTIALAIGAILLGLWLSYRTLVPPKVTPTNFTLFTPAADVSPFQLTDNNGRSYTNMSLQGHWTFIYFGFVNCQSICPMTMQLLNKMHQILLQQAQNQMPDVVMITVDPDNDTPSRLHDYVTSFNPHFLGVTGAKEQIQQLASNLNIVYTKIKTNNGFTIDHSNSLLLLDPTGRLIAVFTPPLDANSIAQDYQNIVRSSG